jgi:hypothetical protein
MKKNIKKVGVFLGWYLLTLPLVTYAQLARPTDSYGLVRGDLVSVIMTVVRWFLTFVGVLSLLMIVVSGIMYITSGGDSGRTETAKGYLLYSIVGLVVALLAYAIVMIIGRALI